MLVDKVVAVFVAALLLAGCERTPMYVGEADGSAGDGALAANDPLTDSVALDGSSVGTTMEP